uniref:Uncharacterized protein n=1 Tax=Cannabis sativa TaxID=3483 RepID=A0A803PCN0_CANSA
MQILAGQGGLILRLTGHGWLLRGLTGQGGCRPTLAGICLESRELCWPQPMLYEISYYFDLKSTPKQNKTGYFYFSLISHQWLGDTNCTVMSKVGGVAGAPVADGPYPGDGQAPELDDDEVMLLSVSGPKARFLRDLLTPCPHLWARARLLSRTLIVPLMMTMALMKLSSAHDGSRGSSDAL